MCGFLKKKNGGWLRVSNNQGCKVGLQVQKTNPSPSLPCHRHQNIRFFFVSPLPRTPSSISIVRKKVSYYLYQATQKTHSLI
ncbi:hypothetical protein Hanom_Chr16g01482141 [Helianthus anomalus]